MSAAPPQQGSAFSALRSFARRREPTERCDFCGTALRADHQHLIQPVERKLVCSCDGCALLFPATGVTKFKRVPRRVRLLSDFELSPAQWDSLLIPIGLAFFLKNSVADRVFAFYPSPAGATESLLPLEAWNDIVASNPVLEDMEADVEALLINRLKTPAEYQIVPIDRCYALVGLMRTHWRGLSGGTEMWEQIRRFLEELHA
jgi:Family of unknown function (DUF5947)